MNTITTPRHIVRSLTTLGAIALVFLVGTPAAARADNAVLAGLNKEYAALKQEPAQVPQWRDLSAKINHVYLDYEAKIQAATSPEQVAALEKERDEISTKVREIQLTLLKLENTLQKGQNLGSFIEYHRQDPQSGNNLLISEEVKAMTIPENMEIYSLDTTEVLEVLARTGLPIRIERIKGKEGNSVIVRKITPEKQTATAVFSLREFKPEQSGKTKEDDIVFLAELADNLADAVHLAVKTRDPNSHVTIAVHRPTRLLIVTGDPAAIEIATKVIVAAGGKTGQ